MDQLHIEKGWDMGKGGKIALGAVGLVLVMGAAGAACGGSAGQSGAPTPGSAASEPAASGGGVTYRVLGEGSASTISYTTNGGGSQEQRQDVVLPFEYVVESDEAFSLYSLTAQNGGGGEIECEIVGADGTILNEATSDGQYAVVSCSATSFD